jgi:SAM-dependent methyltransferase
MNIHDVYRPFQKHFRRGRMRDFVEMFKISSDTKIVDVGGDPFNWELGEVTADVTLVNIIGSPWERPRMRLLVYDGRKLPFDDNDFNVCFSNSVIEHVGSWEDQKRFAQEIRRAAPRYYVQTPNRYFFIEPHLLTPLIHFLPRRFVRRLMRNFTLHGLITRPSQRWIDEFVEQTRLLSVREMRELFPDATIIRERFLGMTKSIIAIRL